MRAYEPRSLRRRYGSEIAPPRYAIDDAVARSVMSPRRAQPYAAGCAAGMPRRAAIEGRCAPTKCASPRRFDRGRVVVPGTPGRVRAALRALRAAALTPLSRASRASEVPMFDDR